MFVCSAGGPRIASGVFAPPPDLTAARSSRTESFSSSHGAYGPSTSGYDARSKSPLPEPPPRDRPRSRSRERDALPQWTEFYGRIDGSRDRDKQLPGPPNEQGRKKRKEKRSWDPGEDHLSGDVPGDREFDRSERPRQRQPRPGWEPGTGGRRGSGPASSNTVLIRVRSCHIPGSGFLFSYYVAKPDTLVCAAIHCVLCRVRQLAF